MMSEEKSTGACKKIKLIGIIHYTDDIARSCRDFVANLVNDGSEELIAVFVREDRYLPSAYILISGEKRVYLVGEKCLVNQHDMPDGAEVSFKIPEHLVKKPHIRCWASDVKLTDEN